MQCADKSHERACACVCVLQAYCANLFMPPCLCAQRCIAGINVLRMQHKGFTCWPKCWLARWLAAFLRHPPPYPDRSALHWLQSRVIGFKALSAFQFICLLCCTCIAAVLLLFKWNNPDRMTPYICVICVCVCVCVVNSTVFAAFTRRLFWQMRLSEVLLVLSGRKSALFITLGVSAAF